MAGKAKAKRKSTVPADETKRQKFIRLGNFRLNKAVKTISQIGNLSGAGYEFTPGDIKRIRDVLSQSVTAMLQRFAPKPEAGGDTASYFDETSQAEG